MFMLSFFEVPKGVLQKIEYYRSRFFWQSDNQKKKYRLIKRNNICQPKDQGGLGIQNIEIKNKCLLAKWLWKLINEEGLWQQILRNKYCKNYPIGIIERKPGDSHFWSGLMKVKDQFMRFRSFRLNNGQQIRFWEDVWIGNVSFQQKYPSLYNIVRKKNDIVASVLSSVPLNVSFRRSLQDNDLRNWNELVMSIMHIQLNDNKDTFKWNLKANRIFTVHSMYLAVINNGVVERNTMIWKLKMPLKIKIFMWYMYKGVTLTKDNLAKRNWNGNKQCVWCLANESIQHLFLQCKNARFIWGLVEICFGLKPPQNTMHMFSSWLNGIGGRLKQLLLVGASAICWAIWLSRNDVVFDKSPMKTFMQVIYRETTSGVKCRRLKMIKS